MLPVDPAILTADFADKETLFSEIRWRALMLNLRYGGIIPPSDDARYPRREIEHRDRPVIHPALKHTLRAIIAFRAVPPEIRRLIQLDNPWIVGTVCRGSNSCTLDAECRDSDSIILIACRDTQDQMDLSEIVGKLSRACARGLFFCLMIRPDPSRERIGRYCLTRKLIGLGIISTDYEAEAPLPMYQSNIWKPIGEETQEVLLSVFTTLLLGVIRLGYEGMRAMITEQLKQKEIDATMASIQILRLEWVNDLVEGIRERLGQC